MSFHLIYRDYILILVDLQIISDEFSLHTLLLPEK